LADALDSGSSAARLQVPGSAFKLKARCNQFTKSLVKQIRKHSAKNDEQGMFLLEGHLLEEACAVNYPLVTVCCTPEWHSLHEQLWQQACLRAERAEIVSAEIVKAIATTVQPDGVATAKATLFLAIKCHLLVWRLSRPWQPRYYNSYCCCY